MYTKHPLFARAVAELDATQWYEPERIQKRVWSRMQSLLAYAYKHVSYYRQLFQEQHICPQDIRNPETFQHIPVLTKRLVRENQKSLLSDQIDMAKLIQNYTGGSTGERLAFYQDQNYWFYNAADKARCFAMCGYTIGDRVAYLWGADYDTPQGKMATLRDRLTYNRIWINVFDLDKSKFELTVERLQRFCPTLLIGYVSSLTMLARYLQKHRLTIPSVHAIESSAEVLTLSNRKLIENTFVCQVFDRYGCREVGNIAHECEEHTGLHILADNNHVEFLTAAGQPVTGGNMGLITVTNLSNYAFPFIRYQTGDLGRPSDRICSCGRGLPLMEVVEGRTSDIILAPGGKLLHGEFFTHLFYKLDAVRQFQVMQTSRTRLLVRIVWDNHPDAATIAFLEKTIHEHGDPQFEIQFESLDRIDKSASGKFRFTISEVPLEF
ncbi:MAG: hypothetical protein K8R89_05625 [Anaerolineae bacterium]|nr:hypothetical protein [Anaerolineae bacterium]